MGPVDRQGSAYLKSALLAVAKHFNADVKQPFAELPKEVCDGFFNGVSGQLTFRQGLYSYQSPWKGALRWLRGRLNEAPSEKVRVTLEELVSPSVCPDCKGRRLRSDSLSVRLGGRGIAEYTSLPIEDSVSAFEEIKLNDREEQIAGQILREIRNRLRFLDSVGLGYLTLDRPSVDALRRRGTAYSSGHSDWLSASRRPLRSRRAFNWPAPSRQSKTARHFVRAARPRQHRAGR